LVSGQEPALIVKILSVLETGLGIWDSDRNLVFANAALQTQTGLQAPPSDFSTYKGALQFHDPSPKDPPFIIKSLFLNERHLLVVYTPNDLQIASKSYRVCLVQHLESLFKHQREKQEFFTQLTHDLKVPLTTIKASIDLLISGLMPFDKAKEILKHTETGVNRMTQLINNIMTLSKFDAGKQDIKKQPLDLSTLVQEVLLLFKERARAKKLQIDLRLKDNLPLVSMDEVLMRRVIENLIDNAVKFTPEKGSIQISIFRKDPATLQMDVADTGIGIPEKQLGHVFEKFKQATLEREYSGGFGVGLATVKEIVKAHQGLITCSSQVNRGTVFSLQLPIN
jgi:two-component system phosphate regulon sensor histidine kinase PhoR